MIYTKDVYLMVYTYHCPIYNKKECSLHFIHALCIWLPRKFSLQYFCLPWQPHTAFITSLPLNFSENIQDCVWLVS